MSTSKYLAQCEHCAGHGRRLNPDWLRKVRVDAGLRQADIAQLMGGVSVPYVSDIENGRRNVNRKAIVAYEAAALRQRGANQR